VATRLTKALEAAEDLPAPLRIDRKSMHEALKELSNIFINQLNNTTLLRVAKKAPELKFTPSPRVAKKAILKNKEENHLCKPSTSVLNKATQNSSPNKPSETARAQ